MCLLVGVTGRAQHTPLTSHYLFNGLVINPAYAGSRDALTANLTHRQQWVGFDGAPTTQMLSIHAPVARRKVGLGLLLFNDRIGVSEQTGLFTNYAYRIRMPHGKLAFGLGLGFTVMRAQWSQVAVEDASDLSFITDTRGAFRPNFSTGIQYSTKRWFVGVSLPFMLTHRYTAKETGPGLSALRVDPQPMITGGHLFTLTSKLKLKPSTLIRYRLETGVQADLTTNLIVNDKVWFGASYRTGDAFIGSIEVLPTAQWRIGYAYDLGLSALRNYHHGTHELMLQYEFGYRIRVKDPRYF